MTRFPIYQCVFMKRLAAVVIVALALVGCALPPLRQQVSAPTMATDGAIWLTVERHHESVDDSEMFVVRCPASELTAASTACEWHALAWRQPESTSAATAARHVAAHDHDCPYEMVRVESSHAEGYWLSVCGTQRFYRSVNGSFAEQPR